jgi:tetratricopeptide (TPR) repeat protein
MGADGERGDAPRRRRGRGKAGAARAEVEAPTEVWRVELNRGLRALVDGDEVAAEGHLERAYRSAPERAEVCFALGRERMRQGKLDEAERLLRKAFRSGGMLAAAAALARCLGGDAARRGEAHAVLDEALRPGEEDEPGLLVVRAELFVEEREVGRAREALERARAVLDREQRDAPATRAAIALAMAKVSNLEAVALVEEGRDEEALFAFKRAFDLDPAWAGPMVNMGAVFARLGRPARARGCYERALVLDPENCVARYNLAELCRRRGDAQSAEAEYRRVLELDAAYPGARVALAELLCDGDQIEAALEVVSAGPLQLAREHVVSSCRVAKRLADAGFFDAAAALVRAARRVDPVRAAAILDG